MKQGALIPVKNVRNKKTRKKIVKSLVTKQVEVQRKEPIVKNEYYYEGYSLLVQYVCTKFVSLLTKNGKKSFGFYILFTTLDRLKVLTRVAGLPLFVSAILSLRPILSISTVEQGRKKVDKYKLLSSQAQVSKALKFFFSLVRKLDSKYDLVTRILVVIVSLVLRKNNALQKLRSMLKLAVLNKYKVAPQLISIPKGSSGFQSSVRRPKKMKGQYFSNYYGLYRKIQYTK